MTRPRIDDRLLGLVTLVVAVGLLAGDFSGVLRGAFGGGGRTLKAVFVDAQQVQSGDLVRIKGVDVGKVTAIAADRGARSSTITMELDSSAGPLYADARAQLRWRTILGASYAVYLDRGTPAAGSLGSATIPQSRTSNQVEVEDVVGVFRDGARTGLQAMPGEFGQAFRDAAPPARAFGTLAAISPAVATGVHGLRGQSLDSDLRTMVAASASTVQALDTPTGALRTLIAAGAATLETTAASQADIRSMIAQGPGTLQSTGVTVRQLNTTLTLADPLIAQLAPPAPDVAPTLARLHPTVVGLDQLLHRAVPLLHSLRPAVTSLAHAADAGLPLLTGLAPTLYRTGRSVLPSMSKIDPETNHSAAEMIGGTFTGVGSGAAAQEDANGHFIRFPVSAGSSSTYLPCQIYYGNPDKKKLAECQTLQQALQTFLTWVNSQVPGGPK